MLEAILYVEFDQGIHSIGVCKNEATRCYLDCDGDLIKCNVHFSFVINFSFFMHCCIVCAV